MESFRDNKLGFYALIYKTKSSEIWIRGKDICLLLGYKDYKRMYLKIIKINHYVRTQGIFVTF